MTRQIMITAVVEDDKMSSDMLLQVIGDILMYKYSICVFVEDVEVTQENYDWKTANGIQNGEKTDPFEHYVGDSLHDIAYEQRSD